jgi:hypothetical protein
MAAGRCEGCGKTGSECLVGRHTVGCPDWLELFARDPSQALSPRESYRRWKDGGKAAERDARLRAVAFEVAVRREAGSDRFRYVDILAD